MKRWKLPMIVLSGMLVVAIGQTRSADVQNPEEQIGLLKAENKLLKATIAQRDETIKAMEERLGPAKPESAQAEVEKLRKELAEARKLIDSLRKELNEANAVKGGAKGAKPDEPTTSTSMPASTMTLPELFAVARRAFDFPPGATRVVRDAIVEKASHEPIGRQISVKGRLKDVTRAHRESFFVLLMYESTEKIGRTKTPAETVEIRAETAQRDAPDMPCNSEVTVTGVIQEAGWGPPVPGRTLSIQLVLKDAQVRKE